MSLTPSVLPVQMDIKGAPVCSKRDSGWEKHYPRLGGREEASISNWSDDECFMDGGKRLFMN